MEFNECEAVVVGHDGFEVQVTQGPRHTLGPEIRVKRTNVVRVEKPTTKWGPWGLCWGHSPNTSPS